MPTDFQRSFTRFGRHHTLHYLVKYLTLFGHWRRQLWGALGHMHPSPLDFQQFNFFSVNFRAARSMTATLCGCLSKHIYYLRFAKEDMFSSLFVCLLFVCLLAILRKNFQTDLHEIFREGWQWTNKQIVKFPWRSGSLSGYMDCFSDSSLLGDVESG